MKCSTQNSVNQVQIKYSAWSTHMKYGTCSTEYITWSTEPRKWKKKKCKLDEQCMKQIDKPLHGGVF